MHLFNWNELILSYLLYMKSRIEGCGICAGSNGEGVQTLSKCSAVIFLMILYTCLVLKTHGKEKLLIHGPQKR